MKKRGDKPRFLLSRNRPSIRAEKCSVRRKVPDQTFRIMLAAHFVCGYARDFNRRIPGYGNPRTLAVKRIVRQPPLVADQIFSVYILFLLFIFEPVTQLEYGEDIPIRLSVRRRGIHHDDFRFSRIFNTRV